MPTNLGPEKNWYNFQLEQGLFHSRLSTKWRIAEINENVLQQVFH